MPSQLGPQIPIHPADHRHLPQENSARHREPQPTTLPKNANRTSPIPSSSPRPPPTPHTTTSSSSSSPTPIPIPIPTTPSLRPQTRGGFTTTIISETAIPSGNDTDSLTSHHILHPQDTGVVLSFFSSTKGLLDYDPAHDTWIPSAGASREGGKGRGKARVVGVDGLELRSFLPWFGRLLRGWMEGEDGVGERRAHGEEGARREGRGGRDERADVDGEDGGLEDEREVGVGDDEVGEERGRKGETSVEESEERRKTRVEDWERSNEQGERIEKLLADEGSGDGDENGNRESDVREGDPGSKRRRS